MGDAKEEKQVEEQNQMEKGIKRRVKKFTPEDDSLIISFFKSPHTEKDWKWFVNKIGHSRRSIKERYKYYLNVENDNWTDEELILLWDCVQKYGSNWTRISPNFPGRSPLKIRDTYNSIGKPKFMKKHPTFTIPTFPNLAIDNLSNNIQELDWIPELYF